MNEKIAKLEQSLTKLNDNSFKILVLTQDVKDNPKGSVHYNYQLVKNLIDLGFNASILVEKKDYTSVESWLGSEYSSLPHTYIEEKELKVGPEDILLIPELFSHVIEQTKTMPCMRIVLCQSYDNIFEVMQPGITWGSLGIYHCITTNREQEAYIKSIFPNVESSVIPYKIPDFFKKNEKPNKPVVAIHTRDHRDTAKIIKTFYVKYPQYKWISFRDMRGMSNDKFAEFLSEACVSVWVDDVSGFGAFPLESMKCGVPVIGKMPNLKPDWLTDENGFWLYEFNVIVDVIANYIKMWLEDGVPEEIYTNMQKTVSTVESINQAEEIKNVFNSYKERRINEINEALSKFKEKEVTV